MKKEEAAACLEHELTRELSPALTDPPSVASWTTHVTRAKMPLRVHAMNSTHAKELLLLPAFCDPRSAEHPKALGGFLGSLRPYGGHLVEENFREVMESLSVLAPELSGATVDREVVGALWAMCHLARAWGVEPEGMLRRNSLISAADVETLADWVDTLSYATMCLLTGSGHEEAFHAYDRDTAGSRP